MISKKKLEMYQLLFIAHLGKDHPELDKVLKTIRTLSKKLSEDELKEYCMELEKHYRVYE